MNLVPVKDLQKKIKLYDECIKKIKEIEKREEYYNTLNTDIKCIDDIINVAIKLRGKYTLSELSKIMEIDQTRLFRIFKDLRKLSIDEMEIILKHRYLLNN